MKADVPHILLVNPWIDDFAAYDVWAQPMGLLMIAGALRQRGYRITYCDCLDRFHPRAPQQDPFVRHGRGPYLKTPRPNPRGLEAVPRRFSRYGIREAWLREDLARTEAPDLILVTSLMTYWYPGLQATIAILRQSFPTAPILLGGIYATLCRKHAQKTSGADGVLPGIADRALLERIDRMLGYRGGAAPDRQAGEETPYPAWDLRRQINYLPVMTAFGCPFDCAYCASRILQPRCRKRRPRAVVEEILYWYRKAGVRDVVIYDDAFLLDAASHAGPILEDLVRAGAPLRFHTPNALHIRGIDADLARLMARAGFTTIRLGLETAARERPSPYDRKVDLQDFVTAARHLRQAGFTSREAGAYLLVGLPGQPLESAADSIRFVKEQGLRPILAYYTPIPHTRLWEAAVAASPYDLAADPLFCNNAIFPCQPESFSWQRLQQLKELTRM